ncbi:rab-protein geranylgeranyltransferase [Ramaria rubella]|nr:rab-protein geranylgeranyltransferase [Ramaria rubella]
MSHGIKRNRESPDVILARRRRELDKVVHYNLLSDKVLAHKQDKDWSFAALDLTKELLAFNPEFYTVWNYRRDILLNGVFPTKTLKEINDLLSADLSMTMSALRQHPKVYWIWNHRRWCLEHVPNGPDEHPDGWRKSNWAKELYVVEKMLDADARNFLAWDYRRYVLASLPTPNPPMHELAYTARKIESNFSNFSAWHQRSKVYTVIWECAEENDRIRAKNEEFELIKQAIYTDPGDQSVWLYHRWLVGSGDSQELLEREIRVIQELLEIEPDSKWCLNTLVHYKSLLLQHYYSDSIVHDCLDMLTKLEKLDSFRKERYRESAQELLKKRTFGL